MRSAHRLSELWDEARRWRNRFWETFGHLALSVVVSVIIAVLLLTRTIDLDAGFRFSPPW